MPGSVSRPTKELEASYLAGPYHPALHQLVQSEIFFDRAVDLFKTHPIESEPIFFCHPREVSNVRGQKNSNLDRLIALFGLKSISIQGREDVPKGALVLQMPSRGGFMSRGKIWI